MWRFFILISCCGVGYVAFLYRQHQNHKTHSIPPLSIKLRSGGYLFALVCFLLASRQIPLGKYSNNQQWQGVDIMVMLDVSQSMLVADMSEKVSRLQFAKQLIINLLQKKPQARWGIGIFAGEAQGILPLTQDANLVSTFLAGLDHQNLTKQWTRLDEAIHLGIQRFDPDSEEGNVLLIISDGWEEQVIINDTIKATIDRLWITTYLIGVGSETWWPIIEGVDLFWNPVVKQRQWTPVISTIAESALRSAATQVKWTYFRATSSTVDQLAKNISTIPSKSMNVTWSITQRKITWFFVLLWMIWLFIGFFSHHTVFMTSIFNRTRVQ